MSKYKSDLFDLQWQRCPDGYEIADYASSVAKGSVITVLHDIEPIRVIRPKSKETQKYDAFSNPSIARDFISILLKIEDCLIESEVIKFANQYGLLGIHTSLEGYETLSEWEKYADEVRRIFQFFDASKTKNENAHLNDAKAFTFFNTSTQVYTKSQICLSQKPLKHYRPIQIRPSNLASVIWLTLAKEMSLGLQMTKCENLKCKNWFQHRKSKKFCSDNCRATTFNNQKNKAMSKEDDKRKVK